MAVKDYDADHYIDSKGKIRSKRSLQNLMPAFGSPERPIEENVKKAHSEEANRKRSETLKKTHAAKKEAKYVDEVTQEVCKRVLKRKLTKAQLKNINIDEWLTDEEKDNLTWRQATNVKIGAMTLLSNDIKEVIAGAEYMATYAGEKPADKTDISIMAENASGVELLTKALIEDDGEDNNE